MNNPMQYIILWISVVVMIIAFVLALPFLLLVLLALNVASKIGRVSFEEMLTGGRQKI